MKLSAKRLKEAVNEHIQKLVEAGDVEQPVPEFDIRVEAKPRDAREGKVTITWIAMNDAAEELLQRMIEKDSEPAPIKQSAYIPKDLDDAIETLLNRITPEDKTGLEGLEEREMCQFHHSTGQTLRNDWLLWSDSRLAEWFKAQGIHHADDMSGIILTTLWRRTHGVPDKLDEQIAYYKAYWAKQ